MLPSDEDQALYRLLAPQQRRLLAAFAALTPKQRAGWPDLIEVSITQRPMQVHRWSAVMS